MDVSSIRPVFCVYFETSAVGAAEYDQIIFVPLTRLFHAIHEKSRQLRDSFDTLQSLYFKLK